MLIAIGEEGERPLIGYTALEVLGFKVNQVTGELGKASTIEYSGIAKPLKLPHTKLLFSGLVSLGSEVEVDPSADEAPGLPAPVAPPCVVVKQRCPTSRLIAIWGMSGKHHSSPTEPSSRCQSIAPPTGCPTHRPCRGLKYNHR